jgi:diguanylate cyclase (GGDEF)-like protein
MQPGRMSALTAINFLLLAAAALQTRLRSPVVLWTQQVCMLAPLLVSARVLVGWLYDVPMLWQIRPMALHTMIAFHLVCIGLLVSRRDYFLAPLVDNSPAGSRVARKVVCWALCLPLAAGICCLQGERLGWYEAHYGVTVFVVSTAFLLIVVVVFCSGVMNRLDHQRQLAATSARDYQRAAECDYLTGLLNRRGFLDRSGEEIAQSRRDGSRLACIVLDLDFFKKINDVHGHGAGDEVIRQFAAVLKSGCQGEDLIARVGGEEFCVLLRAADEAKARALAERLRAEVAARPLVVGSAQLSVTCSGGVAELHSFHAGIHSLIDSADAALLVAKQTGRNKVVTASSLDEGGLTRICSEPLRKVQARDIMVPVPICVGLEATVSQVVQQFIELNLNSLPVQDAAGTVIGFITDQDVMAAMLDAGGADQPISKCSHLSVPLFEDTVEAEQIATFFSRSAVQRVVVVRQGAPVGLVSRRTVLRWFLNHSISQQLSLRQTDVGHSTEREGFDESVRELAAAVSRLSGMDAKRGDELFSFTLVGEVSRIQEAAENLLLRGAVRRREQRSPVVTTPGALSIL